ncbi:AIG2 [Micractinium conductrix]|uniref:Putative gamma-glutamylcyclotransferase n=1 Tax=Micractinium conductrix TaxID=554055 RepID=A0A2P6VF68_9CHLO|nr:AIG2 [Micractinium conductrix]|eukprot:PSC72734.1 AIG2 [Micractinium conductrix]
MTCFVYGTLMYPEVLSALISRVPRSEPALIRGYQRYAIRGQVFPGTVVSTADASVQGLVLFDLRPQELEMFDEFEGDEYFKQDVQAELLESGDSMPTSIYIWQDRLRPLLQGEWDPEAFRQQRLDSYVEMCRGFAADVQAQRGWKGNFPTSSEDEEGSGGGAEQVAAGGSGGGTP